MISSVADDFDDVEDDDNIELEQQEEGDDFEVLAAGEVTGGLQRSKRITTRYMTKYVS